MTKVKNPHKGSDENKNFEYSERTIKKSGGDDFTHNVRSVKLKPRRKKQKLKNI